MDATLGTDIFTDPAMRPRLKALYDKQYEAVHARIDAMEARGGEPRALTMRASDGRMIEGRTMSAAQYRAAIPDFDSWLDLQARVSPMALSEMTGGMVERAEDRVAHLMANGPDAPSGVQSVFSSGDRVLGYVREDGTLVTHDGGGPLRRVAREADERGLTGGARADFILERGARDLARYHGGLSVTTYDAATMPSRREFAETWYPGHDIDTPHAEALLTAKQDLESARARHRAQQERVAEMRDFLLGRMEAE